MAKMPKLPFRLPKPKQQQKSAQHNTNAFIDSQNLNLGVQRAGWKMDWKKFRSFLRETYGVSEAYMFIGYMPEYEDLYMQLHEAGFKIVLKPTYDMTRPQPDLKTGDGSEKDKKKSAAGASTEEEKHIKGNIDADLVLWAMKELPNYQKAIIVSGDGDFYSLVEYLEQRGKLLHILTPNNHYSNLFNAFEQYVTSLDKMRDKLAYRQGRRGQQKKGKSPTAARQSKQGNRHPQRQKKTT